MDWLKTLTVERAQELYWDVVECHFDMTDARLARTALKCHAIATDSEYPLVARALANRVGAHARELLRSRQGLVLA